MQIKHINPNTNTRKNRALQAAGLIAIATAGYHGWAGDAIVRDIAMSEDDMAFVTGTYQIGTMGWVAGGALLIGAARLRAQDARNLIVVVTAVLFGIPAFGTLALTGGEISIGGVALAVVVGLALYGRRQPASEPVEQPGPVVVPPELIGLRS